MALQPQVSQCIFGPGLAHQVAPASARASSTFHRSPGTSDRAVMVGYRAPAISRSSTVIPALMA